MATGSSSSSSPFPAPAAAFRDSSKPKLSWPLIILGLLTLGFAVIEGTGDRQEVINGFGQHVESSIGPAIWTLGVGGAFMTLAAETGAHGVQLGGRDPQHRLVRLLFQQSL